MQTLRLKSKIGPKGQVVVPKPIRDAFGFTPGNEVDFQIERDSVVLKPSAGKDAISDFINAVEKRPAPEKIDWDEIHYSQIKERTMKK
jgi:AbrB family looped-hinge helix DNA binding protein